MFIERLNEDDFTLLSVILTQDIDSSFKTEPFEIDSILLSLRSVGLKSPQLVITDFDVQPANKSAVNIISAELKNKYYKFMIQKFGPAYYDELMDYINSEHELLTALN